MGSGTLILTGNNTYIGGTTISTGTLQIGNGGATGNIIGNVNDNGTLTFDRIGTKKIFAGVISGSGNLTKLGSDTLELTADNTYSGGTTIEAGILVAGVPVAGRSPLSPSPRATFCYRPVPCVRRAWTRWLSTSGGTRCRRHHGSLARLQILGTKKLPF